MEENAFRVSRPTAISRDPWALLQQVPAVVLTDLLHQRGLVLAAPWAARFSALIGAANRP